MNTRVVSTGQRTSPHTSEGLFAKLLEGFVSVYRSFSAMASMIRSGEGFCDI